MNRDKRSLRARARRQRDEIPPARRAEAASAAALHAASLPAFESATVVALYASLPGELSTDPLAVELERRGVRQVYPRVVPGERRLTFAAASLADLRPGTFGIREPLATVATVELDAIDVVLVPGIAFDLRGGRLGWGRGHYDATLSRAPRATRVGYCFADQLIHRVPTELRDQSMDWVVTDRGAHRCQPSAD